MAAQLLKAALAERGLQEQFTVSSAGTGAIPGMPATAEAVAIMAELGYSLEAHRAAALNAELVGRAWLILAMTRRHKEDILRTYPEAAGRVYTIGEYAGAPYGPEWEVADPFGMGPAEYQRVSRELHAVLQQIADRLQAAAKVEERGAAQVRIAFGCDHAGVDLREAVISTVEALGYSVLDMGTHTKDPVDYPDYGYKVATAVVQGEADFGIVVCGSGIGISIAANKVKGIRAALCSEPLSARLSREHNNANVLAMGARLIGPDMAKEIVRVFLTTPFAGGRHQLRVEKLAALEESRS